MKSRPTNVLYLLIVIGLLLGLTAGACGGPGFHKPGGCIGPRCPGAVSFINKENRVPGSEASQAALRTCADRVDPEARQLAEKHDSRGKDWQVNRGTGNPIAPLALLSPFFWAGAAQATPEGTWNSQAAAASDRMAREVGQCMDEQGWIFCTWHQERSGLSMGYRGPGWLCRRKHLDDPYPE